LKRSTNPGSATGSPESPEPAAGDKNKPRFTVLVIDDDAPLRRLIVKTLQGQGIDAMEAADGAEGLEAFMAGRGKIDLVILDLMMPGMNGLDLAAELERRRPGVKILYVSGLGASIAMDSILRESADRVLLKPFTQEALLDRVAHLLAIEKAHRVHATRNWKRGSA
jgi:DNA-binding response OmpR family regulator